MSIGLLKNIHFFFQKNIQLFSKKCSKRVDKIEEAAVILQGTLSEELKTNFGKSLAEVEVLKMEKLKDTDTEDWELDPKYTETYIIVLDA